MGMNTAYWVCAQSGIPAYAVGAPGTGKTQSVFAFARRTGRQPYTLIGSIRDPADIGGYPFMVQAKEGSYASLLPPKWAHDMNDGRRHLLFLDELTCNNPATQSALLRVLAERVVGDMPIPADTWILAAANPPEQAANGADLEAPLANRLYHHKWEFDHKAVLEGFASGMRFPDPEFPVVPANWERFIGPIGCMAAAFHTANPGRLNKCPDDRKSQSGPWPSSRTWEYGIRAMAAAQAAQAGRPIEHTLLCGLVGEAVAGEFFKYCENLDLPDPEVLLTEALNAKKQKRAMEYTHPNRPDKVLAMLSSVTSAVAANNTAPRWEAALTIVEHAAKRSLDAALMATKALVRREAMPAGVKITPEFASNLFPRIKRAIIDAN